jgi:hypothetical protein
LRARQSERLPLTTALLRFKRPAALAAWLFSRGENGDAILALAERE